MKLKYITFIFENCDSITIDGKYVGDFLVDDIKTSVKKEDVNSVGKQETAYTFAIEIFKEANQDYYQLENANMSDCKQKVFDRFTCGDIASIEFELEASCAESKKQAKTEHYFYQLRQQSQQSFMDGRGTLYIVISETESLEMLF